MNKLYFKFGIIKTVRNHMIMLIPHGFATAPFPYYYVLTCFAKVINEFVM